MPRESTTPALSIVVLLTHDGEQAGRCLGSITKHAVGELDCELILILNDSSDAVRAVVNELELAPTVIDSAVNVGTAVGWQLGFNAATARHVLLMHEDAELTGGLVQSLINALDSDPAAAVVGPWLAERGGPEPSNCGWIWFRNQAQTRLTEAHIPQELRGAPYAVDGVSSAISLWERAAWLEGGGFDERNYPALGVDADACTSVWARGRTVLCDPRVLGVHQTGAMNSSPGRLSGKFVRYFMLDRFHQLWREKWGSMVNWYAELPPGATVDTLETPALLAIQERRAQRTRIEGDFPPAQHPFTDPSGSGVAPTAIDDALAERLSAAELAAMDEYHFWLIAHSEDQHAEIEHLSQAIRTMSAREADLLEDWKRQGETIERFRARRSERIRAKVRRLFAG